MAVRFSRAQMSEFEFLFSSCAAKPRSAVYDSFCEAFYCRGDIAAGRTAKSAINAKLNICRLAFKIVEKVSL